MRVIIIGAGIGGTCLAHGLKKHGIKTKIFERNLAQSSGLAGYGIHINIFGQQAMQECLPSANWNSFIAKSRPIGGKTRFYDEQLRLLAARDVAHFKEGRNVPEHRLSISRIELIDILVQGLSDEICWNKTFVRYDTLENGSIRAQFSDGSYEDADVLVGADGSNSRVRKQYLPGIERIDVGVSIIVGRTRLTPMLTGSLPQALIDGSPNSIVPSSGDWMFTSVWRAPVDINDGSPEIDLYAAWAYIAKAESYPKNLEDWAPELKCEEALFRTATWNPLLHTLIKQSDMSSVSLVPLRSMPRLSPWKSSSVTLLGDSIHNMTPMAGVGANTALRDALALSQALLDVEAGRRDLTSSISGYEEQMRKYANEAVSLSLRNAQNAVSSSRLKRTLFRKLLCLAQLYPPVKRMLFQAGK